MQREQRKEHVMGIDASATLCYGIAIDHDVDAIPWLDYDDPEYWVDDQLGITRNHTLAEADSMRAAAGFTVVTCYGFRPLWVFAIPGTESSVYSRSGETVAARVEAIHPDTLARFLAKAEEIGLDPSAAGWQLSVNMG